MWQILKASGIDPAPNRSDITWSQFLKSQGAVACDFFAVDTALLRRYYVLFFIHISTRQVFYAGATANPTGAWTTQAARNLSLRHADQLDESRALVRDRGSQFIDTFDEIFRTKGFKLLKTPVRTPWPARSLDAGSAPSAEDSSTAQSSGTNDNSNGTVASTDRVLGR